MMGAIRMNKFNNINEKEEVKIEDDTISSEFISTKISDMVDKKIVRGIGDNKMIKEDMIIGELDTTRVNYKEKPNSITLQINFMNMIIISICMLIVGFVLGYLVSTFNNYNDLVNLDNSYKQSINQLEDTVHAKQSSINTLNGNVEQLSVVIDNLEQDKVDISEKLSIFEQREELYNKYEYVIEIGNNRTDLTYEQLTYGENLMKDRGLNPHLLFGVVYLESRGNETATNSRSTARGYCQFLGSTAKSVYENMLNKGQYTHDLAFDGFINLELGAEYLSYLMRTQNGSIMTSLLLYNGSEIGERYYTIIDNVLRQHEKPSLAQIEREYKNNKG